MNSTMEFFGRLRHPVQQRNPSLVREVIFEIKVKVERLGFVVTSKEEGSIYFTAKAGRNINDSNILQMVTLAEEYGNKSAKRLNVQFDFSRILNTVSEALVEDRPPFS